MSQEALQGFDLAPPPSTDTSRMVKVYTLQAFVGLSAQDLALRYQTIVILEQDASTGSLTSEAEVANCFTG
jgi:hypothetical protein